MNMTNRAEAKSKHTLCAHGGRDKRNRMRMAIDSVSSSIDVAFCPLLRSELPSGDPQP